MKYNANDVKLIIGGIEYDGCGEDKITISKEPTKKQWYKILEQNEDTFKVEMVMPTYDVATTTIVISELGKFLELEDSYESPFILNNKPLTHNDPSV